MLEIGVLDGASLRMWRDYLPTAVIVAVDIDPATETKVPEGVEFRIADQADEAALAMLAAEWGPFDVVVDDGGHTSEQQLTSLRVLWPHVSRGGLHAVEDVHSSYLEEFGMGPGSDTTKPIDVLKTVLDDLNAHHHGRAQMLPQVAELHGYRELVLMVKDRTERGRRIRTALRRGSVD